MTAPSSDRAAIRQIIRALLAANHALVEVNDGEEQFVVKNEREAIEGIMAVDVATLWVRKPDGEVSFILFVMGNDPEEVAADWGVSLSPVLDPLTESWWD